MEFLIADQIEIAPSVVTTQFVAGSAALQLGAADGDGGQGHDWELRDNGMRSLKEGAMMSMIVDRYDRLVNAPRTETEYGGLCAEPAKL
ncbi:hypothetical protein K4F52_009321 [Lecanicillium sp. MT-2017a]|nr:hypothetical protein K4F52_009321 [Lecanicillium sp. MT-2017a]